MSLLRRLCTAAAAAVHHHSFQKWTTLPLSKISAATADGALFDISLDLSAAPEIFASHAAPGQFVQLRIPDEPKLFPFYLSIASPPGLGGGEFEFLVRSVPGSAAERVCGMREGDLVEVSGVMGRGFEVERILPAKEVPNVYLFATGSGISPIRSLIESGFNADKRSDVRLYYGVRDLQRMAYQDRFKAWESTGVRIIPILSHPDDRWEGQKNCVQAAFSREKRIVSPSLTGAVLSGHKKMIDDVTSMLVSEGVSKDKILKNF